MHYLASRNPYKAKTNLWLQNEHIRTFSGWLQAKDCRRWLKMLSSLFRSSTENQGEENNKACKNKKLVMQKKLKLSLKCKSQVLKWMMVASRNFRSELATEFILPNKDDRKSLKLPHIEYPSIKKEDWKLFVDKILSEQFQEMAEDAEFTLSELDGRPRR
ncbi:hypothetical protein CUMW_235740 [Citrus unshiu]|nr:hypothetical protein CUMW_235740 [Citrus unshiu]